MNIKTMQYWHKLEHFYPYVLEEQGNDRIKSSHITSSDAFNALINESLPTEKAVRYYAVYLGVFYIDTALNALEQGLKKPMRLRDDGGETSCYCKFKLTSDLAFDPESFKISSFPWAIHRVRDGKIILDHWDDDFHAFEDGAFHHLKEHGKAFDYEFMTQIRNWYADRMNWKIGYADAWLRIDRVVGDISEKAETITQTEEIQNEEKDTDEQIKQNDLLNSFYIRDLERILTACKTDRNACGESYKKYIQHTSDRRIDIEHNNNALLDLMAPEYLPKGKWPSNYGLRLMQQLDVNAFLCPDSRYHQSLFSVNGPPGTGKTTLLKDIIAAIITERATKLCALDMPDEAFIKNAEVCTIETPKPDGTCYRNKVFDIKPDYKKYGIIVASNNNGAVENVTNTLPLLSEIGEGYINQEKYYFSEIAELLPGIKGTPWAMNAASLGNQKKNKQFIDAFWPINRAHEGYNFTAELRKKVKNPSQEEWNKAKESFEQALLVVEREYDAAKLAYSQVRKLIEKRDKLRVLEKDIRANETELQPLEKALIDANKVIEEIDHQKEHIVMKLNDVKKTQSFLWLKSIFSSTSPIVQTYRLLQDELFKQIQKLHQERDAKDRTEMAIKDLKGILLEQSKSCDSLKITTIVLEESIHAFKEKTGATCFLDEYFTETQSDDAKKTSPWGYSALNKARGNLFVEAMALHKAFVENSKMLRENLDAFSKMIRGMIPLHQMKIASPVLFQSFLLAVPVISTTFASVGRFLRHIPPQEFAYLFIDEAGQAMPQAAAGAVWRAQNVIAVGDPLQIEPVVTLHDSVIQDLAEYFNQDYVIANKYTSVQSLGDLANILGGYRTVTEENDLWIGSPLIVHNRCQKMVFDISNEIAYNNTMIFATSIREKAECRWIHVKGKSEKGHYVPAQTIEIGKLVVQYFKVFYDIEETKEYPSLFIVSPFRSVKAGLINFFRKNLENMLESEGIVFPNRRSRIYKWIYSCIGTIHTFQGKEADTVILCLGVDSYGKGVGALEWASERPNILNVAVTRSKENLYIVGDQDIWGNQPYFKVAMCLCQKS